MADENLNTESTGINQPEPALAMANNSETLVAEENSQHGPAEQRTNGGGIEGEKLVEESSQLHESSSAGPSATFNQVFGNDLPSQPDNPETSREGNNCAISEGINATGQEGLPIAEQNETGTPSHSYSDTSVGIPCQGTDFTYYASVKDLATNEQCFSVHFVCTRLFQQSRVSRWIKRMQQQQQIKLVPIGDEYLCQCENQYFHTAFVGTHMHLTIKFQLLKQVHRKFRITHAQIADKVPLHHILSLGQHRVPVAIASVFIKFLAEPEEPPCQDHLRVIVQYGDITRNMLIPIWG